MSAKTYRVTAVERAGCWKLLIDGVGVTLVDYIERAEQQVRNVLERTHGHAAEDARIEISCSTESI